MAQPPVLVERTMRLPVRDIDDDDIGEEEAGNEREPRRGRAACHDADERERKMRAAQPQEIDLGEILE